jgi:hypothetical protein
MKKIIIFLLFIFSLIYSANAAIKTPNLLVAYRFEGNANDWSGNGKNGTVNGATLTTGKFGQGYSFNGAGDYVDAGSNPITGTNAFTLSAWINTATVSNYSGVISIGSSAVDQSAYIGTVADAQVGTSNSIGGGFYGRNYGSGITTLNDWVHVAMTFSGGTNGTAIIYINGVNKVSEAYTPNLSSVYLRIGRIGSDTIYDFNGLIDEVRIYNRALNEAEIRSLMLGYEPGEF